MFLNSFVGLSARHLASTQDTTKADQRLEDQQRQKIIRTGTAQFDKGEKTILNSTSVDNSGNIFISYTLDSYSPNFTPIDRIYVSTNNGKHDNIKIELPVGAASKTVVVVSASENNIKITGFYSQNSNNLTGVFSQILNTTDLKISDAVQIPFPPVIVEQFEKDKLASTSTKKYGLFPITQSDIIPLKDGGFNLTGELDNFTFSKTYFNATGSSYPQYFTSGKDICGSLLNIHFSADGKATFTRIPKLSESGLKGYYYKVFDLNDQALIFYSDHFDNLSQDITRPPAKADDYKNSVLIAALISSNGNVQRRIIIDRDKDYRVVPWGIQRLSSSQFLVPLIRFKLFDKSSDEIKWGTVSVQ